MKRIFTIIILLIMTVSLCSCSSDRANEQFTDELNGDLLVHYIDVGQGDCILLESGDDFVLIDAGEVQYGDTVCEYLSNRNVKSLDYVIATHPHSDHCGGLKEVLSTFSCDNFITIETDQQTKTWMDVLYAVDDNNINYIDAEVSTTYTFGDASLEIVGPYSDDYDDYNDYSIVTKVVCGDTSFLFTGDAETRTEKEMISNGANLKADVLKVGHHGSSTSSCSEFLSAVNPDYAVITCGINNDYGHPHQETTDSLSARGITTYRTDLSGTIVAVSDKKTVKFYFENDTDDSKNNQYSVNTSSSESQSEQTYIGNKNSMKLHLSSCESTKEMSENNKVYYSDKEAAINDGYTECKNCNP